jgi:hypothetical protein
MFLASLLVIVIGIILTILSIIVQVLPVVLPEEYSDAYDLINTSYQILLYLIFFVLFLWCGMRAAKGYGFDVVGAGLVAAFSSFVISIIKIIVNAVLGLIVISRPIGNLEFSSLESVVASVLFKTVGVSGISISAVCGIGLALIAAMINFVIGGLGGWLVLRKRF